MVEQKRPKCKECKQREATGEDGFCDSCRFSKALESIIQSRK